MQASIRRRLAHSRGLTLIELIVVMAILVVLAGLTLPKLDVFKLKANKAQAASNIESATNMVTAFKVQNDEFPDVWDSLLEAPAHTALYASLHPSLTGAPGGNGKKLRLDTIATADELKSLQRVGILTTVDCDPAAEFPGNSAKATTPRLLQVGDSIATFDETDEHGFEVLQSFYPTAKIPADLPFADKKVVVFGLGPQCNIIGDLIHAAPFYANANQLTQYNRFLVAYEIDKGGSRARLLGTVGADADFLEDEIISYYEE